jgi:aspartate/methionine/tyrosine aminotransferase
MTLPRTATTFAPPILEAKSWLREVTLPEGLPLIDLSQAAPASAPHEGLRQALAEAALNDPSVHLYSADLGRPELRAALADQISRLYRGVVRAEQVGITSGCNQAFCAAIASLTTEGDEVIVPTPWYFNHKMWLDMAGLTTVPLPTGPDFLPDPEHARALITPRTRAIALVSPNNPTGAEYPPALIEAFYLLARETGVMLILDETYRDFRRADGPAHGLFADPDWPEALIHLYSFSKSYRLTGHRVGAIATSAARLAEVEKFIDTVTICPSGLGQVAALWGIENLDDWVAGERQEILHRRKAAEAAFASLSAQGWTLAASGAYFAYATHPEAARHPNAARKILADTGLLMLPASMFRPDSDPRTATEFRVAFANIGAETIAEMGNRLQSFRF